MDLSPEEYADLKRIFNNAIDLAPAGRGPYLDSTCPDIETRRELENMLAAAATESPEFEQGIFKGHAKDKPPAEIGAYTIVREIGHGGMGSVYEAWRQTESFRQHAAVKVVRHGISNSLILRRFRSEQQILSALEHPNIARFLDGGQTADELPFYAMEFVDGTPIDVHCRQHHLSVPQKIELFRKVCSAVSYAHTRLVVHRDLKPTNILVTADGTPKLLDFGIAKVLETNTDGVATATQFGMMTPQYASPEQVRGEKVTTLSDVYSIGLILFEILTGNRPYETEGRNYAEVLEIISNTETTRPSLIPMDAVSSRRLKGDLDNIVVKALQKDPERRYASVDQLSEDLRRYTAGLPILARADTFSYRFRKFVGRNRISVGAAAVILTIFVAGIGVTTWQTIRAERQRQLAEKRFAEVRTIANNVVFKYHDEIAKLEGSTGVREMLVKDATAYLDNLAADAGSDAGLQRELALAYHKLGDVQGKLYAANIGDTAGAQDSYKKAVSLLESVVLALPDDDSIKDDLLRAYDSLVFSMARTRETPAQKFEILNRSARLLETMLSTAPNDQKRIAQLATLHIGYGDAVGGLENRASLIEKLDHHLRAFPLAQQLVAIDGNSLGNLRIFARINQRLGTDYSWLGQNAEKNAMAADAASYYKQAMPFHRTMFDTVNRLSAEWPDDHTNRAYKLSGLSSYAETLGRNGQTEEALDLSNQYLQLAKAVETGDPHNREAKFGVASGYQLIAKIYEIKRDEKRAAEFTKLSLGICENVAEDDKTNIEAINQVIENARQLAEYYKSIGSTSEASLYQQKVESYKSMVRARS